MPTPTPHGARGRREPTLIDPASVFTDDGTSAPRSQAPTEDATAGTVADRYELHVVLGRGATSRVWSATDRRVDRDVAVKVLEEDWRGNRAVAERFRRESRIAARLAHPGIVTVLDAGVDADGAPYQVMELVAGESLDALLAREGQLSPRQVVSLGLQVLEALAHVHDAGLVHRDVKPGNILVEDVGHGTWRARLTDFGIAKDRGSADALTAVGTVLGTAAYLSPEQATGEPVDARADLYALGCVLFECLTGQRPFGGATDVQVASARIGARVRPSERVEGVPEDLDAVIARAMAPDPVDRFPDAPAMAAALRRAALDRPATTTAASTAAATTAAATTAAATTAAAPTAPATTAAATTATGGPDRGRALVAAAAATALLALIAVLLVDGGAEPTAVAAGEAATAQPSTPQLVPVAGIAPFDPQGDGSEHASDIPLLLDGDPATQWTTEGYDSAAFGNLKEGVGAIVDLDGPHDLATARLLGVGEGVHVEVRAATSRPTSLADTTVVGVATGGGDVEVALEGAEGVQHVVVWVVGPLPQDGRRHRAAIGEVQLIATR